MTSSSGKVFFLLASRVRFFLDGINEHFSEYIHRRMKDFVETPLDNKDSNDSTQTSENLVKNMPMVRLL